MLCLMYSVLCGLAFGAPRSGAHVLLAACAATVTAERRRVLHPVDDFSRTPRLLRAAQEKKILRRHKRTRTRCKSARMHTCVYTCLVKQICDSWWANAISSLTRRCNKRVCAHRVQPSPLMKTRLLTARKCAHVVALRATHNLLSRRGFFSKMPAHVQSPCFPSGFSVWLATTRLPFLNRYKCP